MLKNPAKERDPATREVQNPYKCIKTFRKPSQMLFAANNCSPETLGLCLWCYIDEIIKYQRTDFFFFFKETFLYKNDVLNTSCMT